MGEDAVIRFLNSLVKAGFKSWCMAEFAKMSRVEVRGLEFAPINFGIADDLSYWSLRYLERH
jgi:hypothetical protein